MDYVNVSHIITEFTLDAEPSSHVEYFKYNDLGIPLAFCLSYDLCKLTSDGERVIEETWNNLCKELNVNPSLDYDNLSDMVKM